MKKLILPIVMLLVGIGGGVGAGIFLSPPAEEMVDSNAEGEIHSDEESHATSEGDHVPTNDDAHEDTGELTDVEYAKLANQFVIPLVLDGHVTALVVMTISLEVPSGGIEAAFAIEPRLRDTFLQVMFDHANIGGFSDNFTDSENMRILREELNRSAKHVAGEKVSEVLILDIVRQDI